MEQIRGMLRLKPNEAEQQLRVANFNGYSYAAVIPPAAPAWAQKALALGNRVTPGLVKWLLARKMARMSQQQLEQIQPIPARLDAYRQDEHLPHNREQLAFFKTPICLTMICRRCKPASGTHYNGPNGWANCTPWSRFFVVLPTCAILMLLLGFNIAPMGLVPLTTGWVPALLELLVLIVALNFVFVIVFLLLARV